MSKKDLTNKDIAIVIATYNRSEDLPITLKALKKNKNVPGKIIVVDQSTDNKTKKVVEKYKKSLPIVYRRLKNPSSSVAKNTGINEAKKDFPLILILDDDVDLLKGYLNEALNEFNKKENLMGLGGIDIKTMTQHEKKGLSKYLLKLFFLPYREKNTFKVVGPYGNTMGEVTRQINDVEWLPGFNMLFRSEVFKHYSMPESVGYNVLEDIDSSYYIFKKYGPGSLLITPQCKTLHRYSSTERYMEKKRIFVNHEDHFYFYYKYFPGIFNKIKFMWSIKGILAGNLLRFLVKPKKENLAAMKYNFQAIDYCFKHRNDIKKGKLRSFLNKDRSLKEEYQ